ncbi:MAG: hypothetical protein AAF514_04300 [Verrucomicrobiota bacterium]
MNATLACALVLGTLLGLMMAVRSLGRRFNWHPESQRKLVHMGMGLIALSFPWLFDNIWPVIVLGAIAIAALLALKLIPTLRNTIGGALHDVDRSSYGDLFFTIAIVIVFTASQGDPIKFCIPMAILTFADAVGALIGVRYGKTAFATLSGKKSAEGSAMFFMTCFMVAHVPLLLFTDLGRAETLLISLILATMVMMVEAVSTRGIDNLIIPVAGWYLISEYMAMDLSTLMGRTAIVLALMLFVLLLRKRTSLDGSSLLGSILFGYGCWALGGWLHLLIVLLFYISHLFATHTVRKQAPLRHDLYAVISIALTGLIWLVLEDRIAPPPPSNLIFPFALGMAAHFGIRNFTTLRFLLPDNPKALLTLRSTLKAVGFCFVPLLFQYPIQAVALQGGIAIIGCLIVTSIFARLFPDPHHTPTHVGRWSIETVLCALISFTPAIHPMVRSLLQ